LGVHYKAGDVDHIRRVRTDFNSFVPYVGVGYDNSLLVVEIGFLTERSWV